MLFKTEGETTCFQADYGVESSFNPEAYMDDFIK
jgi:hypothetical protein